MRSCPVPALAFAGLAWLAAVALTTGGCADESNPVLPPSSGPFVPGGTGSSTANDAAAAADTAAIVVSTDATTDELVSDALWATPCNLLRPDCPVSATGKAGGCYPDGATGRATCQEAGLKPADMTCGDHTDCAAGLVCVAQTDLAGGLCKALCDRTRSSTCSSVRETCGVVTGFPEGVGACIPIPS